MASDRRRHKERGLIEATRRAKPKRLSPLDVPTVVGWNNPAAEPAAGATADRWARLAALIEAERSQAQEQRRRTQRNMIAVLAAVLGMALVAALWMLLR